jgi:hypothetical protein
MTGYRAWRPLFVLPPTRVWRAGRPRHARWGWTLMHAIARLDRAGDEGHQ